MGLPGSTAPSPPPSGSRWPPERPTHALLGDLTALHDATGLVIGPREPRPDLRIVVANDDGGSIFATLEHGRPAHMGALRAALRDAPGHCSFAGAGGGGRNRLPAGGDRRGAGRVLAKPPVGIELVEAVIDRTHRRSLDAEITALAATL